MKTRLPDPQSRQGLPPPPAPTARDANPWPISADAGGKPPAPRHPRARGRTPRPGDPTAAPAAGRRRNAWIPLVALFVILGTGVQMAITALAEGDVETAAGALVIFAIVGIMGLRQWLKQRQR